MTDYNDLITRLRSMDGKTPMAAADAIAKLVDRVAYLESRLEVTPEHDIDGIAARDATIHHQDECISELKFRLAEAEDANKALRVRLGSELERANERLVDLECELYSYADVPRERLEESRRMDELKLRVTQLEAELAAERAAPVRLTDAEMEAERDKQEPVVWEGAERWEPLAMFLCADENGSDSCHELIWEGYPPEPWGERWQKYELEAKRMIDLVSQYAAPPVITQHEPVTTVEDRYNADGKSCHITDDLPAGMPLYADPPVAAPVRLTDSDVADLFRAWNTTDGASYADLILSVETAVLRANGFKLEGEQ